MLPQGDSVSKSNQSVTKKATLNVKGIGVIKVKEIIPHESLDLTSFHTDRFRNVLLVVANNKNSLAQ